MDRDALAETPGRAAGLSTIAGVCLGAALALVFTVSLTIAQPNFVPESFWFAAVTLLPISMLAGVGAGAAIGAASGAIGVAARRSRAPRTIYVVVFVGLSTLSVAALTNWSLVPVLLPVVVTGVVGSGLIAALVSRRIFVARVRPRTAGAAMPRDGGDADR